MLTAKGSIGQPFAECGIPMLEVEHLVILALVETCSIKIVRYCSPISRGATLI